MSRGIAVITFPGSNGDHDALDGRLTARVSEIVPAG